MNNNDKEQTNGGSNNDYTVNFDLNEDKDKNYATSSSSGNYNCISDLKLNEQGTVIEANIPYTVELSNNPEKDQVSIVGTNPLVLKLVVEKELQNKQPNKDIGKE